MSPGELPPVSVIIPAFNEEQGVATQVAAVAEVLAGAGMTHEIIVVDDGSEDGTGEAALGTVARVLRHDENRGYGASLKTGILAATHDVIIIMDADGTYPAGAIPDLVEKLAGADMVVAARSGEHVHIPLIRRPGKWLLGKLAVRIAGRAIPDLNSGLRAFRRSLVREYFYMLPSGFSFTTTITLAMLSDGYRVTYRSINYARRTGRSKIRASNFMEFIILILRTAILFEPLKVFLPMSMMCGGIGLLKAVYDVSFLLVKTEVVDWTLVYTPVISTSAILFLLIGMEMLLIGMVADALLRRINRGGRPQQSAFQELSRSRTGERSEPVGQLLDRQGRD